MTAPLLIGIVAGAILAGTSFCYAALGETIGERAGIVNLGLEGLLLVGASTGFSVTVAAGSAWWGLLAAAAASAAANLIFAWLVVSRRANQLASGLALMFFGFGVSALVGARSVGAVITGLPKWRPAMVAGLPWVASSTLFRYDVLTWLAVPVALLTSWVLFRTRWGLRLRAVGENPAVAYAAGARPALLQYQALLAAGVLAGLAGAHLSLSYTLEWKEFMTSGRGFMAIALVIFCRWHPARVIGGALLFGGAEVLQYQLQAAGLSVSPFLLGMVPYVLTLLVLAVSGGARLATPASLGRTYYGSE